MKVILTQTVDRIGASGQVVNVKNGFARNYLLPRKLALPATPANLGRLELIRKQFATREDRIRKRLTGLADKLGLVSVKTSLRMGEEGAFGAITNAEVARLLAREGFEVDKHSIVLAEPVKAPGVYDVPVKLGHDVTATVKLWVAEASPEG
ncbi:MAG: 50S ribosomal protein L9 [bacterium]